MASDWAVASSAAGAHITNRKYKSARNRMTDHLSRLYITPALDHVWTVWITGWDTQCPAFWREQEGEGERTMINPCPNRVKEVFWKTESLIIA